MGIINSVVKGLGAVVGVILKPLLWVVGKLIDIPKPPSGLEESGSQYNSDVRVNEANLGDVKPVVYGRVRVWPPYQAKPYTEFQGHDQVFNAYLHLTVGYANVLDIRIGDTPANNFPGFEYEVCLPGEDMTLIRPNVYTCPEVAGGIEMLGGLLAPQTPSDQSGRVTVQVFTNDQVIFDHDASTITATEEALFEDFVVGDLIGIYDSNLNEDFDYTILEILDDYTKLKVTPQPVDEDEPQSGYFVRQRWAGPYPACQPGATVHAIGLDFVFTSLRDEDEDDNIRSVVVVVQCRPIDDVGTPLGDWEEAEYTFTDSVNRPRRYTVEFIVETPARYEARTWRRTYEQADSEDPSSALQWVGLKGYIVTLGVDAPASDPDTTRIAIRIRSSGMLSGQSERRVSMLVERLLSVYSGGSWTAPQVTRSPAWAYADWMVNHSQGAIALAAMSTAALVECDNKAEDNGDTFDAVFDREVSLWDGSKTILRVARSKPIFDPIERLYGVYRDEPSVPVLMFCDGINAGVGETSIGLPDADTVTGIQVTFMDPILWVEREGPLVGTDTDVRKVRFMGNVTWNNSWREAQYEFRDLYYRQQSVSVETEMEGLLPVHGERVLVVSAEKGWGQCGEVREQDEDDETIITVYPAPIWSEGVQHFVYLQGFNGVPGEKINVTQGDSEDILVLESAPDVVLRIGSGWNTLYAFGHDGDDDLPPNAPRIAIVTDRSVDGQHGASLNLLFDHPFVHEDPGAAPDDPYELGGTIPSLGITGLTLTPNYSDVLVDEEGDPILDEDGEFIYEEGGSPGVTITADWDDVAGVSSYSMRWRRVGGDGWHAGFVGISSEATFGITENGDYQVRVKAISGSYVGTETLATITISGIP